MKVRVRARRNTLRKETNSMAIENDVVLIYYEDEPVTFARIETILPDHKKDWYHVKLLMLQLPLQTVTWILRDIYINGEEFTMGGKRMRIERVVDPDRADHPESDSDESANRETAPESKEAKVISLADLKKR